MIGQQGLAVVDSDDRLRQLRAAIAEAATELRLHALAVDADPDGAVPPADSPALTIVREAVMPERYRGGSQWGTVLKGTTGTCVERVVATVELSRGDAGAMLAVPGAALAGIVVDALGSEEQQDLFYRTADGRTWTFFAMTEPDHGSDATAMETALQATPDGYLLSGQKRYIGNGARGGIGVVFARTGRSPLAIRAVLLSRKAAGWSGRRLETQGLRGACLSALEFDGVEVPRESLLGEHLPVSRRGLWGALQTFNSMRIQIGAMGVGTGLAMLDYVTGVLPGARGAEELRARLEAARGIVYQAAAEVDRDPDIRSRPSTAKLVGTRIAVTTARWAATALGPGGLLAHPLLEKWTRDAYGLEFMDGASNIQRLNVTDGYLRTRGVR